MAPLSKVLPLLGLFGLSYAAYGDYLTQETIEMEQWGTTQTYSAVITYTAPATVTYESLLWSANACYNWLKTQPGITTSGSGIALVSCVGIHGSNQAFCASVPRGDAYTFFDNLFKADAGATPAAPIWQAAVRGLLGGGTPGFWGHAEDFAYYRMETEGNALPAGTTYPDGTTVAVWHGRSSGDRGVGEAYLPCYSDDVRDPTCMQVASTLGVTYAANGAYDALTNPQGPAQPNTLTGLTLPNEKNLNRREEPQTTPQYVTVHKIKRQDVSGPPPDTTVAFPDAIVSEMSSLDAQSSTTGSATDTGTSTGTGTETGTGTGTGTITNGPTATPTCYLRGPDPDAGITASGCDCSNSVFPVLSTTDGANESELCAYTTMPTSTTSLTGNLGPATTNTKMCQICTQVNVNEDSCTTIPNCLVATAKASVTAATSGMHVGTLTGDALYTSVSSALEEICPPVTQTTSATECSGTAVIKDIDYVDSETLGHDGVLDVTVAFSSYNVTSLRDAMIVSLATTAQQSAVNDNCYEAEYEILEKRWTPRGNSSLFARDHPEPFFEKTTLCNTAELALVNYYSQYWRTAAEPGATDYIEVQYNFHESGGGSFACIFAEALLDALAVVEPEFAVEDVELGEAIELACEDLNGGSD